MNSSLKHQQPTLIKSNQSVQNFSFEHFFEGTDRGRRGFLGTAPPSFSTSQRSQATVGVRNARRRFNFAPFNNNNNYINKKEPLLNRRRRSNLCPWAREEATVKKTQKKNVRMRRNEEVQFNLSGLIIRSKVIIKSRFQRKKPQKRLEEGRERYLFERGAARCCVRPGNTTGAKKIERGGGGDARSRR